MAELSNTTGSSSHAVVGRRIRLTNADSPIFDVVTITGNDSIGARTSYLLAVTASGANRNLSFLAAAEEDGGFQAIYNAGPTYSIVVKDSTASTIITLAPGELVALVYDATAWAVLWKITASGLPTISPTTITLTDNSATALVIGEGANAYLTFDTANSSESVRIHKILELLAGGIDMSLGAAGQVVYLKDNEAAALDISEGANVYLRCVTTNSGEQVVTGKPIHLAGGIATASRFTSTEQTGTGSAQNVAHGLGSTPSLVWWSMSQDPAGTGFTVVPGAHGATNCVFTVTAGVKFYVFALK
jgi:hypothetical protein